MSIAQERLDKEINIIEIIKSRRYFESAIKFLLTEKQRMDLKQKARYIAIDPNRKQLKESLRNAKMIARTFSKMFAKNDVSDGFFSSQEDLPTKIGAGVMQL